MRAWSTMPAGQSAGNGIVIGAGPLCAPDTQYATLTRNTIQFRFSMQSAPSFFVCALHGCVCRLRASAWRWRAECRCAGAVTERTRQRFPPHNRHHSNRARAGVGSVRVSSLCRARLSTTAMTRPDRPCHAVPTGARKRECVFVPDWIHYRQRCSRGAVVVRYGVRNGQRFCASASSKMLFYCIYSH